MSEKNIKNDVDLVEEKRENKTLTKKNQLSTFNKVLSFCAYIGIGCIAIALLLSAIFKGDVKVASAIRSVGESIAYILSMILAYYWVKRKTHVGWLVCYVIFVVTIVVLYILVLL